MSDVVIRAENLGKKYRIQHQQPRQQYVSLRDVIAHRAKSLFRKSQLSTVNSQLTEDFWALKDVNFEIKQGEVVGIIGRNGAGKSTLLKILSRITEPTNGRIGIKGRVASLLEVGTGFHPELTGRENIYLNGAILGMSREEIKRKFDEIVAFAEVEKFLDTPVKRYSSGMYVRLAFAVAAHLEPELLIVDEVLAVGDATFQKKCLGRMKEIGKDGRTVLFVSHNMAAVSTLCNKAAWLNTGHLVMFGEVRRVIGGYLTNGAKGNLCWRPSNVNAKGAFSYHSVKVVVENDSESDDSISADSPFHILFDHSVTGILPPGRLAFLLTNQEGTVVLGSANTDETPNFNKSWAMGRNILRCIVPGHFLTPGHYHLTISEPTENGQDVIHENIISFLVNDLNSLVARDGRQGVIAPKLSWKEERIKELA